MSELAVSRRTNFRRKSLPVLAFAVPAFTTIIPGWNQWVIENAMVPLGQPPALLMWSIAGLICIWWYRGGQWITKVDELTAANTKQVTELTAANTKQVTELTAANTKQVTELTAANTERVQALEDNLRVLTAEKEYLESKLAAPHGDDQHCFDLLLPQIAPEIGQLSWLDLGKFSGRSWSKIDLDKAIELRDGNRLLTFHDGEMQNAYKELREAMRAFISGLGDHAHSHMAMPSRNDLRISIKYDESADATAEKLLELAAAVLRARDKFIAAGKAKNFNLAALYTASQSNANGASK